MIKLREKLILNEDDDLEVIPAAELEAEPLVLDAEIPSLAIPEVPAEVETNAFVGIINSAISSEWNSIDSLNSIISTFMVEKPEATSAIDILKQLVDEKTAHVGMLQKALELIDGKTAELVKSGEDKAEEIISEVPSEDFEEVVESPEKLMSEKLITHDSDTSTYKLKEYWFTKAISQIENIINKKDAVLKGKSLNEMTIHNLALAISDDMLSNTHLMTTMDDTLYNTTISHLAKYKNKDEGFNQHTSHKELKEERFVMDVSSDLSISEQYWANEALYQIQSIIENADEAGDEDEDEDEDLLVLQRLSDESIHALALDAAHGILNDDYVWETVNESLIDSIWEQVYKYKDDPALLTAKIEPAEDVEEVDMQDIEGDK